MISLDFKPSGEGTSGNFQVDNIRLTNKRELPKVERPAVVKGTIKGNFNEVINRNCWWYLWYQRRSLGWRFIIRSWCKNSNRRLCKTS